MSRQIGDLEDELGVKLFDRVGRRLMLTGEGEQLLGDCRSLLACAAAVKERAQQLQRSGTGVLKVAASPQIIEGAVAGFLRRYAQHCPDVQVKLVEAFGWPEVVGLIEHGDVHLGLNLLGAAPPDDQRFASHALEPIDLLVACCPTDALVDGDKVEIARLSGHPLLLLDASYVFRRTFDAACRLAGLQPKVAFESRTPHTLLAMAENGHRVAIIPSALPTDRRRLRIAALTYRGKPLREQLAMYWDRLAEYMREVLPVSPPTNAARRPGTPGSTRR